MKFKWQQAPVKTQWGDEMVVASVAIDKDHTVSLYCEREQTANVEAMFAKPAQTDWEAVAADQAMTIALLRAEQPAQQEPVGTYGEIYQAMHELLKSGKVADQQVYQAMRDKALYTSPQPAQRKPLTYEEITAISKQVAEGGPNDSIDRFVRAIEAKLKEKNNG